MKGIRVREWSRKCLFNKRKLGIYGRSLAEGVLGCVCRDIVSSAVVKFARYWSFS